MKKSERKWGITIVVVLLLQLYLPYYGVAITNIVQTQSANQIIENNTENTQKDVKKEEEQNINNQENKIEDSQVEESSALEKQIDSNRKNDISINVKGDTYIGNINSELKKFNMKKAGNGAAYVSGEIVIVEWIDEKSTVPEVLPKIRLKSTDGTKVYESFITPTGTNTYYFDQYIEDIDHSKEYIYELESGNPKNVSANKSMQITISNRELGIVKGQKAKIEDNKLMFVPDTYIGDINSDLKAFSMKKAGNGAAYVNGEIVIVEWVDGKSTVPKVLPKIRLKSTDGTKVYESFITPTGTNTYYFDQYIEDIDHTKEYIYELESGNPKNVSANKSMQITISNRELGIVKGQKAKIENNKLIFVPDTYIGDINSDLKAFSMKKAGNGAAYVNGEIVIVEWIDGKSTVPKVLPKIRLKSTDGTKIYEAFITPTGTNTYYFDQYIEDIDHSKEYIYEIESGDSRNVSTKRTMQMNISDQELGLMKDFKVRIENNTLKFVLNTYIGNVTNALTKFNVQNNERGYSYISGELIYIEWVDGKSTVPKKLPKIKLISEDGIHNYEMFTKQVSGNTYYFDLWIEGILDSNKTYYIETESGDYLNVSTDRSRKLNFGDRIGEYKNFKYTFHLEKSQTITVDIYTYIGDMTVELKEFNLVTDSRNYSFMRIKADIYELVNDKAQKLEFLPNINLKSTDGTHTIPMEIETINQNEYTLKIGLDKRINADKDYYLEVESGDLRNISELRKINATLSSKAGEYKNFKYTLTLGEDNIIRIEQERYIGNVVTQEVNLNVTSNGYITGEAIVVEWVNGKSTVPAFNPIIKLKSTDGTIVCEMFVKQKAGNTYYFDLNISQLELRQAYQIEIASGDLRNESTSQVQILGLSNKTLGIYGYFQGYVENSMIKFKGISYVEGIYGQSGLKIAGDSRGSDLRYYQIGNGPNVAFMVFEQHGFEDLWNHDGQELIEIAEQLKTRLVNMNDQALQNKWTIYIIPEANPDGVRHGWSNNGPGRQTLYGAMQNDGHKGIDMNRCWQISGNSYAKYDGRYYNGSEGFSAYEARSLRDFLLNHRATNGQTILVELHGWTNQIIGDQEIGNYYKNEFPTCRPTPSYGTGYLIGWARASLGANGRTARAALIELPSAGISSHQSVVNAGYADKFINATINVLRGIV